MPGRHDAELADLHSKDPKLLARRLFAEWFGTFLLVMVDAGGAVIAWSSGGEVSPVARSLATGLLIMSLIYAMGDVSGAHFNPAVTLAFTLRGAFPAGKVLGYWLAQLFGALAAAFTLRALFGNVADLGATNAGFGAARAVVMEIFLTTILVSVILGTATRHRIVGPNAAIASGGAIALSSLIARPVSGASMNPARSLAPALVSGATSDVWVYLVGPFAGAALATLLMSIVHPRRHEEERDAAEGEKKEG
jgi:aquaporin Z